jgi:hypothetical protein
LKFASVGTLVSRMRSSRHGFADLSPHPRDSQRLLKLAAQPFQCGRTLRGGRNAKVSPTRMTHFQETLRQFTLENRRKTPALLQSVAFKTSHVCTGDTVLQEQSRRNKKSLLDCGQTVEDGTSLWKAQEKWKTISCVPSPRARQLRSLLLHAEARRVRPPSTRRAWATERCSSPGLRSVRPQ